MSSIKKRHYALDENEISLLVSVFDANGDHYMDFRHAVNIYETFDGISQDIQCRLLNKKDQKFEFMRMIYQEKILEKDDVPDDHQMKDSDILIVYCMYFAQKDPLTNFWYSD